MIAIQRLNQSSNGGVCLPGGKTMAQFLPSQCSCPKVLTLAITPGHGPLLYTSCLLCHHFFFGRPLLQYLEIIQQRERQDEEKEKGGRETEQCCNFIHFIQPNLFPSYYISKHYIPAGVQQPFLCSWQKSGIFGSEKMIGNGDERKCFDAYLGEKWLF